MIDTTVNRRASTRFSEPFGTAEIRVGAVRSFHTIRDASSSGIALEGAPIENGTPVALEMHWPSIGKASGQAIVRRQLHREGEFALEYTHMLGVGRLMGKICSIERQRLEEPKPLFCGQDNVLQRALSELSSEGVPCEEASSPLAALRMMQDPWNPITSIVLSPARRWLDFSNFVAAEYPSMRRVLLHQASAGDDARTAIEQSLVDLTLSEPWTQDSLYGALGLTRSEQQCLSCQNRLTNSGSPFCATCHIRSTNLDIRDDLGGGD